MIQTTGKHILTSILLATSLSCTFLTPVQAADVLAAGSPLPDLAQIKDQHDKAISIPVTTQKLIFAADNTGASLVTAFLDAQAPNWLETQQAFYLADIHKMPGFVTKMFALPQLREKPYLIALGREEADLAVFPRQKGCVTLMKVADSKVSAAEFACSEDALKAALMP
jgi:hypothetical protein